MRRVASSRLNAQSVRFATGVAPVLYIPEVAPQMPRDEQVKKNTNVAVEMIKRFKGPVPPAYNRKTSITIEQIEKEIDALLGSGAKLSKPTTDDRPMDKMALIERCLRHALWSYHKDEGSNNFAEMSKWIVYTPDDEVKMSQLKRQSEAKTKLEAFRAKKAAEGLPDAPLPKVNWAEEYSGVVDRELINEKRVRYDSLLNNTVERDQSQIDAVLQQYRQPAQQKRLDDLVELLERFKPVLAREAIMQRLTIKHLEGQLGVWRYMDWCPEVRDRAELEVDVTGWQWWSPMEERRLLPVRLRTVNEVREIMAKTQAEKAVEQAEKSPKASKVGGDSDRERLLKEVLALQARLHQREDA